MAEIVKTGTGALKLIKPSYIVATLYTGAAGETDDDPKGDTLILEDVVQDTTTLSQDDNETTTIERETDDNPIIEIVKQGKTQFNCEIGDSQVVLLRDLAGYTVDSTTNIAYAPAVYKTRYAKIAIVFEEGDNMVAYVAPKVQLNTKTLIESLNSNLARTQLAGTAQTITKKVNGEDVRTSVYLNPKYELPTE